MIRLNVGFASAEQALTGANPGRDVDFHTPLITLHYLRTRAEWLRLMLVADLAALDAEIAEREGRTPCPSPDRSLCD